MIYVIMAFLLLGALAFLLYPVFTGTGQKIQPPWTEENRQGRLRGEKEELSDRMESAKLALRDLDMENKIGKISPDDFEILKGELLEEWVEAKHDYESALKKEPPQTGDQNK